MERIFRTAKNLGLPTFNKDFCNKYHEATFQIELNKKERNKNQQRNDLNRILVEELINSSQLQTKMKKLEEFKKLLDVLYSPNTTKIEEQREKIDKLIEKCRQILEILQQ